MRPRSMMNRQEVLRSEVCACCYCRATFAPADVVEWTDPDESGTGQTAVCPRCGVDSVVGSASGLPVTSPEFLRRMHADAFG